MPELAARPVETTLRFDSEGLTIEIRDHGPGFDAAESVLPGTLFRTSKPGGLGIGLALSHATVERLGGSISMHAASGGPGLRVVFELPMTRGEA
jgi:two-component system sensor histidine kinase RegB